jgi:hypothetical protein
MPTIPGNITPQKNHPINQTKLNANITTSTRILPVL